MCAYEGMSATAINNKAAINAALKGVMGLVDTV